MTNFTKENMITDGAYLFYSETGNRWDQNNRFIARFKHGGKRGFVSFLMKNFTVEEYFAALDTVEESGRNPSPGQVLESKGYIADAKKKELRRLGYQPNIVGYRQYCVDNYGGYFGRCPA